MNWFKQHVGEIVVSLLLLYTITKVDGINTRIDNFLHAYMQHNHSVNIPAKRDL